MTLYKHNEAAECKVLEFLDTGYRQRLPEMSASKVGKGVTRVELVDEVSWVGF